MSCGRGMLFSVQPLVWGYRPVRMVERDGVHTACVTYARSNTVLCEARRFRLGVWIRALP